MNHEVRKAVEAEFSRYSKFLAPVRYQPILKTKNFLDWLILWFLYRNSPESVKPGQVAKYTRHHYRSVVLDNGETVFVFLTHIVHVIATLDEDSGFRITSGLHWKYSMSSSPLDTINTSLDCTSAVDAIVPINVRLAVKPTSHDDSVIEASMSHKNKSFIKKIARFFQIVLKK